MKLNIKAFALASGFIFSGFVFTLTWRSLLFAGGKVGNSIFAGHGFYQIIPLGSVFGFLYGWIEGVFWGALFAWLYNLFLKIKLKNND